VLLVSFCGPDPLLAQNDKTPAGFQPLFNSRDLTGWSFSGGDANDWFVDGGALVTNGRPHGWLMTEREYDDFDLRLEYRVFERANSGVLVRGVVAGDPVRAGMEIQIVDDDSYPSLPAMHSTGAIYDVAPRSRRATKPAGEWNAMRIVAKGSQITVFLNDVQVVDADLKDYKDQFAQKPWLDRARGYIGLQSWDGKVEFRNVQIKALSDPAPPVVAVRSNDEPGFKSLFNGGDLSGWKFIGGDVHDWFVDGGALVTNGRPRGWLMTQREYDDFDLRLEYRVSERGNSGVLVRGAPADDPVRAGMEIQIVDDDSYPSLPAMHSTGAIYDVAPRSRRATKPAGEWNAMRIVAKGSQITVFLNDIQVVDADLKDYKDRYAQKPWLDRARGYIGLQSWDGKVEFRNVQIKALSDPAPPVVAVRSNDEPGFKSLFNGQDLTGWEVERGDPALWGVENGAIVGRSQDYRTRSFLLTDREYSDFVLRLDFNLDRGTGGAVSLRAMPGEEMPYKDGSHAYDHPMMKLIESFGQEETGTTHWLRAEDLGGVYLKPGHPAEMNPAGSWNTLEIEVRGRSLRASVNGKPVLVTTSEAGVLSPDGSLPGLNRPKGRIGLQKHTGTVRFRNIQVQELTSGDGPSLYVLSIGINDYADKRLKLDCAAPDARDLRQAFLTHSRRQFPGGVEARLLLDAQATRANILEGLKWLAGKAKGNDVAVVFYAGHGDSQIEGQFYLVPVDANLRRLGATGVSGQALKKALGDLPCTTMLILDACDSGAFDAKTMKTRKTRALPTATDTMLKQMVNDEGLVVMCGAAKGTEAAEENGHGFFTRAIIDGLSGKADIFKKGRVDLIDLQAYVINRVGELSAGEQEPTMSIPSTVRSFPLSKP